METLQLKNQVTAPNRKTPPEQPNHPGMPDQPNQPGQPGQPGPPNRPTQPGTPEGPHEPNPWQPVPQPGIPGIPNPGPLPQPDQPGQPNPGFPNQPVNVKGFGKETKGGKAGKEQGDNAKVNRPYTPDREPGGAGYKRSREGHPGQQGPQQGIEHRPEIERRQPGKTNLPGV